VAARGLLRSPFRRRVGFWFCTVRTDARGVFVHTVFCDLTAVLFEKQLVAHELAKIFVHFGRQCILSLQ
jgi:hypothetical protein